MADSKVTAIDALAEFKSQFSENNAKLSNSVVNSASISTVLNNNIVIINNLLTRLIGTTEQQNVAKALLATTTSNINKKAATPTYNTRAPYVEVYLNGAKAIPTSDQKQSEAQLALTSSTDGRSNILAALGIEVLFSDLELTMPFGGVKSTITGTLKLFSRTPIDLLSFMTNGLADESNPDSVGLPTCDLKFGWKMADSSGGTHQVLSPVLSFLVTNIQMSDPGKTIGSEFTLSLQDAGSSSLNNTSANLGLFSDYPQQQLRVIIEKLLGIRLFTLDDLLELAGGGTSSGVTVSVVNSKGQNTDTTEIGYNPLNETFFVTAKNAAVRVNCNTLQNVVNELLTFISCRWYPVSNNDLTKAQADAGSAEQSIRELRSEFNEQKLKAGVNLTALTKEFNEKLLAESVKLSGTCILVYVPSFPANIETSSHTFNGLDTTTEGAYLLLPKYIADNSLTAANIPVIYGPGGSGIPYFYGGGQNVFQRLTDVNSSYTHKGFSNTVGEVFDLALNFNSFIAVMKNRYNEQVMTREEGAFLSPNSVAAISTKLTAEADKIRLDNIKIKKFKDAGYIKTDGSVMTPEEALAVWKIKYAKVFKAQKIAFTGTISAKGKLITGDSAKILQAAANTTEGTFDGGRTHNNQQEVKYLSVSRLNDRVGTFLQYPLTIGMTVLGDPFLLRQGIGTFEVINYYPTIDGETFKFNPIVSGVYVPQTIIHRLSLGEYMTEIRALKVPNQVSNTATATYIKYAEAAQNTASPNSSDVAAFNSLMEVDLSTLSTSNKSNTNSQTVILTKTLLQDRLKTQMDATFAEFNELNGN